MCSVTVVSVLASDPGHHLSSFIGDESYTKVFLVNRDVSPLLVRVGK